MRRARAGSALPPPRLVRPAPAPTRLRVQEATVLAQEARQPARLVRSRGPPGVVSVPTRLVRALSASEARVAAASCARPVARQAASRGPAAHSDEHPGVCFSRPGGGGGDTNLVASRARRSCGGHPLDGKDQRVRNSQSHRIRCPIGPASLRDGQGSAANWWQPRRRHHPTRLFVRRVRGTKGRLGDCEPDRDRSVRAWGYSDAESFGGGVSECTAANQYGCVSFFVTITYQRIGDFSD